MIIECENCASRFNLDDSLLKIGGSKVRCSICRHVFIAYPPEEVPVKEPATGQFLEEDLEETFSLDSGPDLGGEGTEPVEGVGEAGFDEAFELAMEEVEPKEEVSPEQVPETGEEDISAGETAAMISGEGEEGEEAVAALPKKRPRRSRAMPIILLILLLILGGAAAVYFYAPHLIPDALSFLKPSKKQQTTDPGVARLSFKAVTGSFVQSDKTGQLFVIKGMVTNGYLKPRSFILIKGSILDDKGQAVRMKMVYAGNTFTEKEIKEKPLEELDKGLKNRFGRGRMNFNVKPEGTVPFMIILENLPENISEFTVEAVRSTPGM